MRNLNLEEIRYEGYAPGGIALIVDAVTDNRNRTASEVRSSFTKYGGNLGETGSVSFMFNNVGHILYQKDIKNDDEILEIAIEVGADDVISDEMSHEIITQWVVSLSPDETFLDNPTIGNGWTGDFSVNDQRSHSLIPEDPSVN